ncbi:MAG: T9SS type A sorting domain-containing protein, partial [Flavicella sp.]
LATDVATMTLVQVKAGETYTVSFYAKTDTPLTAPLKLIFQSDVQDSFQAANFSVDSTWKRYFHTFTVVENSSQNQFKFWYLQAGISYYLDEVSVVPGTYMAIDPMVTYQKVDGFGAGIKRRTEDLYTLNSDKRASVEAAAFRDLQVNMIRFFIYHDLQPSEEVWNWTRYESDPSKPQSKYVAEALQNAFDLSTVGFDHVIGNCNTAPGWMKKNESHKRENNNSDVLLNTLKDGYESKFTDFLTAFIRGMNNRYGIEVTAVSPSNEPDYLNTYESMNSTPTELIPILKDLHSKLEANNLKDIQIVSPECGSVTPKTQDNLTELNSTTTYIQQIFEDTQAKDAVAIVAAHTYFDASHNTNWDELKNESAGKQIWVTESANLKSKDRSMIDAANYIKWMVRGFNEGGITGYMVHLFYESLDEENGTSALVLWDDEGNVVLPKRYYVFKHFSNLVTPGYRVVKVQQVQGSLWLTAFQSEDASRIVIHLFNEGPSQQVSVDIPTAVTQLTHYTTSNTAEDEFRLVPVSNFSDGNRYLTFEAKNLSLHSFVYKRNLSSSLTVTDLEDTADLTFVKTYPNPSVNFLTLEFSKKGKYTIRLTNRLGMHLQTYTVKDNHQIQLNVTTLNKGLYFLRVYDQILQCYEVIKFVKK